MILFLFTGYEKNANQAKDAIMKIINDFVSINSKYVFFLKYIFYSFFILERIFF